MAKVNPHLDLGTGYVQLSRLPFDQAMELKAWLPMTSIISLNTSFGQVNDAVQFSEYEYWFDYYYAQPKAIEFDF
jgi:hypothetical protein